MGPCSRPCAFQALLWLMLWLSSRLGACGTKRTSPPGSPPHLATLQATHLQLGRKPGKGPGQPSICVGALGLRWEVRWEQDWPRPLICTLAAVLPASDLSAYEARASFVKGLCSVCVAREAKERKAPGLPLGQARGSQPGGDTAHQPVGGWSHVTQEPFTEGAAFFPRVVSSQEPRYSQEHL